MRLSKKPATPKEMSLVAAELRVCILTAVECCGVLLVRREPGFHNLQVDHPAAGDAQRL
jgi:hypothetical protein